MQICDKHPPKNGWAAGGRVSMIGYGVNDTASIPVKY